VEEVKKVSSKKRALTRESTIKRPVAQFNKTDRKSQHIQSTKLKRTSLNKIGNAGLRDQTIPRNASSRDFLRLETEVNRVEIPEDVRTVSQLQWYRLRLLQTEERTRETLKPCRVLSRGEAVKQIRRMDIHKSGMTETKAVIQYLTFPNVDRGMYKCVDKSLLIPFGYPSEDGSSATFNDDYLRRYLKQEGKTTKASSLEAMRLFIKRVFDHARDTEKRSREQADKDLNDYYDDTNSEDDGDDSFRKGSGSKQVQFEVAENTDDDDDADAAADDLDVPYTQAITFDPDDFGPIEERSNEPIRPGDVIQYYSPIFVAGDSRGLRQATVLAVDPTAEMQLTLSNGEYIPENVKVKRIKVILDGELVDHPGIYRPISRFKLVKRGSATAADAIAMEASRFGRIMQTNMNKLKKKAEANGFAPMDLIVNFKGAKTDDAKKCSFNSKLSKAASSRVQDMDSVLSSSSEDSDESDGISDDNNKMVNQKVEPQSKKEHVRYTQESKSSDNKENNGSESRKVKRMSLGSLSSAASLGSSLASSDDSSIESVNLGMNHKRVTQHETSSLRRNNKNSKARGGGVAFEFSLSSEDDDEVQEEVGMDECKTPPKARPISAPDSFNNGVDSESSFDTPSILGWGKKHASKKPAQTTSSLIGSSKRQLTLGTTLGNKMAVSSSLSSIVNNSNSARKARRLSKPAPSHSSPSSDKTSPSSGSSLLSMSRKQAKPISQIKPNMPLSKRSSSSDSVEIVTKPTANKKPPPSSNLFTSDQSSDSDDCVLRPKQTFTSQRKQSRDLLAPTKHNATSNSNTKSAEDQPSSKQKKAVACSAWTQGMAGWEKSSAAPAPSFGIKRQR